MEDIMCYIADQSWDNTRSILLIIFPRPVIESFN